MNVTALRLVESEYSHANVLHLDFETCNETDLRRVGADIYSRDPSLIVTVVAWAWDDEPVQSVVCPETLPIEVELHLRAGGRFKAFNAAFESAILANHYGVRLDPSQPICTQQAALHSGLPGALGDAGPAIGAGIVKDASAHRLMLQLSRPRKTKAGLSYWHLDEPAKLEALRRYCERDVESERGISRLIAPLPETEQRVSTMDRAANERGVRIDLDLVAKLKALAKTEIAELNAECSRLTDGAVTSPGTQVQKLLEWLQGQAVPIDDLGKEAVQGALQSPEFERWPAPVQRVLEIRQEVAKSSLKKLDAMARCAGPGDRVRGQLAYYGAFRTGRFAGRLIQPQNFPRPTIKSVEMFIDHLRSGASAGWIRLAFGKPLECIASALRGCLVPADGHAFVIYDLSQIEARVVAWLAGQGDTLDVYRRGEDVYVLAAAKVGSRNRNLGKALTLACGFQMGPAKFQDTAAKPPYNVTLTLEEAERNVRVWRELNPKIVSLWWAADRTVKKLLADFRVKTIEAPINDKVSACVGLSKTGRPLLTLELPSGRRLYYRDARLMKDEKNRDAIVYSGVDQHTKRWGDVRTYGGKLVENLVQSAARDVIVEAALRIDARKLGDLVLSVHDELVFEVPEALVRGSAAEIEKEVNRRPVWALDLPVASEGGVRARYAK